MMAVVSKRRMLVKRVVVVVVPESTGTGARLEVTAETQSLPCARHLKGVKSFPIALRHTHAAHDSHPKKKMPLEIPS